MGVGLPFSAEVDLDRHSLFRTGTSTNYNEPAVGAAYNFNSGTDQIVGSDISFFASGQYIIQPGTYRCTALIQPWYYQTANGTTSWQWRNIVSSAYFGNQISVTGLSPTSLANAARNNRVTSGVISTTVATRVGVVLRSSGAGSSFTILDQRSFISIEKIAD